jgi:hypothetical protein
MLVFFAQITSTLRVKNHAGFSAFEFHLLVLTSRQLCRASLGRLLSSKSLLPKAHDLLETLGQPKLGFDIVDRKLTGTSGRFAEAQAC